VESKILSLNAVEGGGAEDGRVGRGSTIARKAPKMLRTRVKAGTEETTGKDETTAARASETLKGASVKADPAAEVTAGETPVTDQKEQPANSASN
jgi:hypothetical protein